MAETVGSARDLIGDAAADCTSVTIGGDVYLLADAIVAALSAAGYVIVPREPTKRMLHDGAQVLINSQDHKGVGELAVFPVYEIYTALLAAKDTEPHG